MDGRHDLVKELVDVSDVFPGMALAKQLDEDPRRLYVGKLCQNNSSYIPDFVVGLTTRPRESLSLPTTPLLLRFPTGGERNKHGGHMKSHAALENEYAHLKPELLASFAARLLSHMLRRWLEGEDEQSIRDWFDTHIQDSRFPTSTPTIREEASTPFVVNLFASVPTTDVSLKTAPCFEDEGKCYKLKTAIYGLKQAGRQWHLCRDARLKIFGTMCIHLPLPLPLSIPHLTFNNNAIHYANDFLHRRHCEDSL